MLLPAVTISWQAQCVCPEATCAGIIRLNDNPNFH